MYAHLSEMAEWPRHSLRSSLGALAMVALIADASIADRMECSQATGCPDQSSVKGQMLLQNGRGQYSARASAWAQIPGMEAEPELEMPPAFPSQAFGELPGDTYKAWKPYDSAVEDADSLYSAHRNSAEATESSLKTRERLAMLQAAGLLREANAYSSALGEVKRERRRAELAQLAIQQRVQAQADAEAMDRVEAQKQKARTYQALASKGNVSMNVPQAPVLQGPPQGPPQRPLSMLQQKQSGQVRWDVPWDWVTAPAQMSPLTDPSYDTEIKLDDDDDYWDGFNMLAKVQARAGDQVHQLNQQRGDIMHWTFATITVIVWTLLIWLTGFFYVDIKAFPTAREPNARAMPLGVWYRGLFQFTEVKGMSFFTCICSPVRWADTIRMSGLWTFWPALIIYSIVFTTTMVSYYIPFPLLLGMCVYYRQRIREQFNIPNCTLVTIVEDTCTHMWCNCCAIVQEARQLEEAYKAGDVPQLPAERDRPREMMGPDGMAGPPRGPYGPPPRR